MEESKILEIRKFLSGKKGTSGGSLDFFAVEGTPILAAASGEVILVKDISQGDNVITIKDAATVIIKHQNGENSRYMNLKPGEILVSEGKSVEVGEMIGFCYSSNGEPSIHFEVFKFTKENPNLDKDFECLEVSFNETPREEAEEGPEVNRKRHHRTL